MKRHIPRLLLLQHALSLELHEELTCAHTNATTDVSSQHTDAMDSTAQDRVESERETVVCDEIEKQCEKHTSRQVLEDQVEFAARLERVLELHEERVLRAHDTRDTD